MLEVKLLPGCSERILVRLWPKLYNRLALKMLPLADGAGYKLVGLKMLPLADGAGYKLVGMKMTGCVF